MLKNKVSVVWSSSPTISSSNSLCVHPRRTADSTDITPTPSTSLRQPQATGAVELLAETRDSKVSLAEFELCLLGKKKTVLEQIPRHEGHRSVTRILKQQLNISSQGRISLSAVSQLLKLLLEDMLHTHRTVTATGVKPLQSISSSPRVSLTHPIPSFIDQLTHIYVFH